MKTDKQLRDKIAVELGAVVDYRGSEAIKHVVLLLDALMEHYKAELVTIDPAQLGRKQGAAMQVKALYDCIVDPAPGKSARV